MCGILGYHFNNDNPSVDVEKRLKLLSHRGPDASGLYRNQNQRIILGHQRLSIIDLSDSANQPFYSSDRRYIMVYNGELYNYRELIKKHALGVRTQSDTEVMLALFIKLGESFVHELNGMFALAIYDSQEDELFLYRDRIGIKPLYYRTGNSGFSFASELPALLSPGEKPAFNEDAVQQFMHLGYIPEPLTIYNGLFKFPAGSWARYKNGTLTITAYWKAEDQITEHTFSNEKRVIDEVHELLTDSVNIRLHADVPFGTFLSGGADSGLISAIAAKLSPEPINTFNVSFEDALFDETSYALQMAELIGSNHFNIKVTRQEVMESFNEGIRLVGEPFADSSIFPTMAVSRFAAQKVKMALSGDGGDELFMGYGMYNWSKRMANPGIWRFRRIIAAMIRRVDSGGKMHAANILDVSENRNLMSHIFSQDQNLFSAREIERITKRAMKDPFSAASVNQMKRKLLPGEAQAFFDLNHYLKDDLLVKVDRASMRYGLEVRVPFLDHRLVALALNIDPALKTKGGESKYIVKKILEQYYPGSLIYRRKYGFSIPLKKWLKQSDELRTSVHMSPDFHKEYEQLLNSYTHKKNSDYLYNRLYVLKCLAAFQ